MTPTKLNENTDVHLPINENKKRESEKEKIITSKTENLIQETNENLNQEINLDFTPESSKSLEKINKKKYYFQFSQNLQKKVSIIKLIFSLSSKFEIFLFSLGIIGAIGAGITSQFLDFLTGKLINILNDNSLENLEKKFKIKLICLKYVYIGFSSFISGYLMMCFLSEFSRRLGNKYRIEYFNMLIEMNQKWFDQTKKTSSELSNLIVCELENIEMGIGRTIGNFLNAFTCVVFSIVLSLIINWKYSLILSSIFPFLIILQFYIIKIVTNGKENQRKINEKTGGYMEEILYKIKTVASFANFDYEKHKFNKILKKGLDNSHKVIIKSSLATAFLTSLVYILFMISFISAGIVMKNQMKINGKIINSGDVYSIVCLIANATLMSTEIAQNLKQLSDSCASSKNFFELKRFIEYKSKKKKKNEKIEINDFQGKIEFKNVNFSYPTKPNELVLNNFNLVIPSGKTTAIIGESGCGKSTIVNLIEKIYNTSSGEIILDDKINISKIKNKNYRKFIGYVSQEPVLFHDTIKNNILFGREIKDEKLLIEATKKACIYNFIQKQPKKFEHKIGVKGSNLSGGQKQRIAIARAILNNPNLLILDEATSALDIKSEKKIQKSINQLQNKITIIIIAHRLTTVKNVDNIIFLGKGGKILEQGNHEYLMKLKGKYYNLYNQGKMNSEKENEELNSTKNENSISNQSLNLSNKLSFYSNLSKQNSLFSLKSFTVEGSEENKSIKDFLQILKNFKCLLLLGISMSFISGCITVFVGCLLGAGINAISGDDLDAVKKNGIKYGLYMLIMIFVGTLIEYFRYYSFDSLGEKLVFEFKEKIFDKYLGMHMGYFDLKGNTPGKLVSNMNIKTAAINGIILSLISMIIQSIGNFISSNILGFIYDWRLTLFNLAFIPFIILANLLYTIIASSEEAEKMDNSYGDLISEYLSNMLTIYSFNAEEKCKKEFEKVIKHNNKNSLKYSHLGGLFYGLTLCIIFFDYSLTFYMAGKFYLNNSLTLENFLKCDSSVMTGTFFIGIAIKYIKNISTMKEALKGLFSQVNIKSEIDPNSTEIGLITQEKDKFLGKIEFKNVSFSYPSNKSNIILNNISFTIQPGEKIGFIGDSGAGKSTITQLLERFYDINEGEILIDGINIKKYNLISLRKIITSVQQEPNLFNLSIKDNIKYGNLDSNEENINIISKKCNIEHLLNNKNYIGLSGGEKQRVAIARSLIKQAKILLLDEATSALDNKNENQIQEMLNKIIEEENFTVIVIAHRLKAVEKCDRCYKMENGKIIKFGTLNEIINSNDKKL